MNRPPARPRLTEPANADVSATANFPFATKANSETAGASLIQRRIFDATEQLLQTKSLGDLTVADILPVAGVSRTTFYRYFTSKHMVVSARLKELQDELLGVMLPWSTRGKRPPGEALREAMTDVATVWSLHRPVLRASSESWHREPEIGEQWVAMINTFVADIAHQIDRERKAGVAPDGIDSTELARHLAWGSERMLYLAGFGICGPGLEKDVVESLVAVWTSVIYKT